MDAEEVTGSWEQAQGRVPEYLSDAWTQLHEAVARLSAEMGRASDLMSGWIEEPEPPDEPAATTEGV